MVLDKLGGSLQDALKKLVGASRIDEKIVDEVVRDIQRALLQADVNVKHVMVLSQKIKQRSLKEEPPGGMNPREHVRASGKRQNDNYRKISPLFPEERIKTCCHMRRYLQGRSL
jgi:signal recognition particle GTPase